MFTRKLRMIVYLFFFKIHVLIKLYLNHFALIFDADIDVIYLHILALIKLVNKNENVLP